LSSTVAPLYIIDINFIHNHSNSRLPLLTFSYDLIVVNVGLNDQFV
jgi:hypothetical protein